MGRHEVFAHRLPSSKSDGCWNIAPDVENGRPNSTPALQPAARLSTTAGWGFPTAAIGLFGLVSGDLSLLCHWALEPATALSLRDVGLLAVMGLGPLGAAFFLWDKALKLGDPRHVGLLSYFTPLASTALLMVVSGRALTWSVALAAALIVSAALLGTRSR